MYAIIIIKEEQHAAGKSSKHGQATLWRYNGFLLMLMAFGATSKYPAHQAWEERQDP
jgi:hypothetical protein